MPKLKNIRSNGKTLEENWQYKIEGSKVTINKSAVAEFGKSGASYADFVFVMSKGQKPDAACQLRYHLRADGFPW